MMFSFIASKTLAQDIKDVNARSPKTVPMSHMEKKALKKKDAQKALADKAIAKGIKRHEKLQTRAVRKRMRQSKQTASQNNEHKKEFFLKRWFRRKQKTKSK